VNAIQHGERSFAGLRYALANACAVALDIPPTLLGWSDILQ
jgi:hypothetical protein